jgi:hypothetical protein
MATDDDAELDFVVGAAVREPHGHALANTDKRACSPEKQSLLLDAALAASAVNGDLGIPARFLDMRRIVGQRADDLRQVGDRLKSRTLLTGTGAARSARRSISSRRSSRAAISGSPNASGYFSGARFCKTSVTDPGCSDTASFDPPT